MNKLSQEEANELINALKRKIEEKWTIVNNLDTKRRQEKRLK